MVREVEGANVGQVDPAFGTHIWDSCVVVD